MSKIWITSDTHFNHKNIVRGCSEWKTQEEGSNHNSQQLRDFDTLEEHNETLIKNFNDLVKEDDILYHLGDWSFGGIDSIWNFRKRLNCKSIHLIYGNHDEKIETNKFLPNLTKDSDNKFEITNTSYIQELGKLPKRTHVFTQNLFTSVSHYKEINMNKQKICLFHYSMKIWNRSHKGSIQLYGHSHGSLPEDTTRRSMDVGIDTNNLKPYLLLDIIEKLNKRPVVFIDHHTDKTN